MKLGIIGTGRIAHRFVPEARTIKEVEVYGVCNPNPGSAERFAAEYGIPFCTEQEESLADAVDAVYIATPHQTHYRYAKKMLSRGVHVLCEKPMVFSKEQAEELFALARENSCVLMEAVKTAYCPGFVELLTVIESGKIGKIYDVEACFSRLTSTNVREMTDAEYGGSFTELATYPLLPVVKILGTKQADIRFHSVMGANGTDIYTKAYLDCGETTGLVKTGLGVKSEGQLVIAGTKGYVLAESPWWLTKKFEVRYEDAAKREVYTAAYEGQGLRYEIQAFADRIAGKNIAGGVTEEESIWLAGAMEQFQAQRNVRVVPEKEKQKVRIWAHRGCSMAYPENTLEAFSAAAALEGITGIELDVQMTKDGELVVIHDETVDRTTDGTGKVCAYTCGELKQLHIAAADGKTVQIPTLEEVFDTLQDACREKGLCINIELKNSLVRYEGMEEKVLALVKKYGLERSIVYSSFLAESMGLIKKLCPTAETGILGCSMQECIKSAEEMNADALHPWIGGFDLTWEERRAIGARPVRAWNGEEPFFGQDRQLKERDLRKYVAFGATDIITNVPELYLG